MSWLTKEGFEQTQERRAQDWVKDEVLDDTTIVLERAREQAETDRAAAVAAAEAAQGQAALRAAIGLDAGGGGDGKLRHDQTAPSGTVRRGIR